MDILLSPRVEHIDGWMGEFELGYGGPMSIVAGNAEINND